MEMLEACRMCWSRTLQPAGEIDGFPFIECAACGFTFTPSTDRSGVENRYQAPDADTPEGGWAHTDFLDPAFERLGRQRSLRVMDFGAGESRVPGLLRERGHRVIEADLAPPARPHPDRYTGPLRSLPLPFRRFDLIYSFQVFEHLAEPASTLSALLGLTRPGGLVAIHTDMEVPERDEEGFANWWYVIPPATAHSTATARSTSLSAPRRTASSGAIPSA